MISLQWNALRLELDALSQTGQRLPLWWRDDDAVGPTPQLDRLHAMAADLEMPVHLAIIPADAVPELGQWLQSGSFRGVVHGWAHRNHAPAGTKSSEFGTPRAHAIEDAARGLERLRSLFGAHIHAMFVPPWNRIDPGLIPRLPAAGFHTLSTFGPRSARLAAPGLTALNAHVDPVDWRGTRGLADPEMLIDRLVNQLIARRRNEADAMEPFGILTHHLMMDEATWDFCHRLLCELRTGPVDLFDIAAQKEPT